MNMKIKYDPQVDAAYMDFIDKEEKRTSVDYSSEEYDHIIFDYNSAGEVIGIEFLQVSTEFPQLLKGIADNTI